MKMKVAIIGFGFMGHVHLQNLQKREDIQVVAVCDISLKQLEDAPETVHTYTDMDELLSKEQVDTVLIVTPNNTHFDMVAKAALAGKNIICEKPAALSVEEYDRMIEVVNQAGVNFTVHQQRRWDKDYRISKEVYEEQSLGEMYTIQSKLYGFNGNMHDWHVYPEFGGGMLFDWGVHLIDQMLYMVPSKVKSVFADIRNVINENVDDYFKIILCFENGVTGEIELGTYFLSDKKDWFERHWFIGGNKGSMYLDGFFPKGKVVRTTKLLTSVPGMPTMSAGGPTRSFGPPEDGIIVTEELPEVHTEQSMFFDNFVKAVNGEEEFVVKKEEVRRVLALMEAARESSKLQRSVDFE